MTDHEARFAADFGRSINRWDWWNLKGEHTPFQWNLQWTAYNASPIGERRADMRAARNTANLMIAQHVGDPITDEQSREIVRHLTNYLKDADDYANEADLKAIAILKGRIPTCQASATS